MVKNSPLQRAHSSTSSQHQSAPFPFAANARVSLLYQLEQRKVIKLEEQNRKLQERINNLLSEEDEKRIELLVADKIRRKLVQLRAITERAIKSLESGLLKEFRTFVDDIDDALDEQEQNGALRPLKMDPAEEKAERILHNFNPKLKRIPESPMAASSLATSSVSKLNAILRQIDQGFEPEEEEFERMEEEVNDNETVEETEILEEMEVSVGAEAGKENAKDGGEKEEKKNKEGKVQQKIEKEEGPGVGVLHSRTGSVTIRRSRSVAMKTTSSEKDSYNSNPPVPVAIRQSRSVAMEVNASDKDSDNPDLPIPSSSAISTPAATPSLSKMSLNSTANSNKTIGGKGKQFNQPSSTTSTPHSMVSNGSATGRAKRNAAAKVGSYKLPPLNKKMRRE